MNNFLKIFSEIMTAIDCNSSFVIIGFGAKAHYVITSTMGVVVFNVYFGAFSASIYKGALFNIFLWCCVINVLYLGSYRLDLDRSWHFLFLSKLFFASPKNIKKKIFINFCDISLLKGWGKSK